jgi:ASC-1-like (ASCH) protein
VVLRGSEAVCVSLCMLNRKMLQGKILNFNKNLMKCRPTAVLKNESFEANRKDEKLHEI